MFKSQNNQAAQLAELENRVAEATKNLIDAKLSHRRQHNRVVDLRALLDEDPNSPALAAEYRAAEADADAARIAVEKAHQAVHAAERGLDLARTGPLRKENAVKLRQQAKRLGNSLPAAKLAIATVLEAMDNVSYDLTVEPGPQLFRQMIAHANGALAGGDAERLIVAMRARADAIESGDAPAGLRESPAEEAVALRKSA